MSKYVWRFWRLAWCRNRAEAIRETREYLWRPLIGRLMYRTDEGER